MKKYVKLKIIYEIKYFFLVVKIENFILMYFLFIDS